MELTRADWEFLMANTLNLKVWHEFLDAMPVTLEIVQQAWYLCDFYMSNTIPLITIMEERDKLVYEKRVVNLLINSFNGVAEHSALLNRSHLKKREFHEAIESLIERNAIWVEAGPRSANHLAPKIYKVNKALYENWKQGVKNFSTLAQPIHFDQTKSVSFDKTG